jgi:RNA polymerase sigma-32 factor
VAAKVPKKKRKASAPPAPARRRPAKQASKTATRSTPAPAEPAPAEVLETVGQGEPEAPAPRRNGKSKKPAAEAAKPAEAADDGEDEDPEADEELLDDDSIIEATGEVIEDRDVPGLETREEREERAESKSLARVDALQMYMREVQRHPLLSPQEEHKLAVHYAKSGDVEAAAKLVTANLRLVVKIAYEYRRAYRNMMDLIQEGNIGLMQAVKRYDPYRGVKLSSYAAWWIRAYMLRFILNNWRMVKIGTTQAQRKLFFNLSKEKARLSALGIEPSHAEIAKRLNVDEKDVVEMDRRLSRGDASLDASVSESDGKPTTRMDLLPAAGVGPDLIAEGSEIQEIVRERLDEFRKTLSGKDVAIFDKRLVSEEPMTLQQLGDEFGVSRERVRQLEARLTGRLRDYLRETLGDAVEVGN